MTTNNEVLGFLYHIFITADDMTPKEKLATLGCMRRLSIFDEIVGEFEEINDIKFFNLENAKEDEEVDHRVNVIYEFFSVWDAELELVLDYMDDWREVH